MKLIRTREYLPILLIGIVLFIIGAIVDKSISQAIYADAHLSGFGIIFSNLVMCLFFFLAYIVCIVGALILLNKKDEHQLWIRIVYSIIFIGGFIFLIYQSYHQLSAVDMVLGKIGGIIFAVTCTVVVLVLSIFTSLHLYRAYEHKKLFRYCIILLFIIVLSNALMVIFKYLWSRPRPWYVFGYEGIIASHLDEFKNVYEPTPFAIFSSSTAKEYFKSFPSNHTNNAVMIVAPMLLYTKLNNRWDSDRTRLLILGAGFIIALLTLLTRMIAGAHYLSDTSFGLILGFSVIYFVFLIVDKKFYEHNIKE